MPTLRSHTHLQATQSQAQTKACMENPLILTTPFRFIVTTSFRSKLTTLFRSMLTT